MQVIQISMKFILQIAFDIEKNILKDLDITTFQLRNVKQEHNPYFLLVSCLEPNDFKVCHRDLSF